ncbi:hypothetical protein CHELA1G11_50008 [Hyphomicrobiales bacterium]|nr:hypothetical protein CHELA1G11_50008 [Hyphomicrobiales bacterium]
MPQGHRPAVRAAGLLDVDAGREVAAGFAMSGSTWTLDDRDDPAVDRAGAVELIKESKQTRRASSSRTKRHSVMALARENPTRG